MNRNRKNVVRLTESKLRNMIKESVKDVLSEMDADKYNAALKLHPKLMSQVDPRTFANRAKGVNTFGQPRNDDRKTMQKGAINAWNKQRKF